MSVTHGADVEALHTSSREIADVAQALFTVNVALTARVWDFDWNGPDATRFRGAWEAEHSPTLGRVCVALNQAAAALVEQAADQERASSATGATSSVTDDLHERLAFQRDVLGLLPDAATIGQVLGSNLRAARSLAALDEVWQLTEAGRSTFARAGGAVLGAVGAGVNAHGVLAGIEQADAAQVFQNGVPLLATGAAAAGVIGSGTAAAVTVPFGVGTLIGNHLNEEMEGTRYGERVTENFETVFDAFGPAGMLLTPVVLLKSGLDMIGDDGTQPPPIR